MTKLLEENHIDLPEFVRGWERTQVSGNPEHALSAWVKPIYDIFVSDGFISYLLIYHNMKPPSLGRNPSQFTEASSQNYSCFASF